jgi:hypothetical protein|tara:strand:- start:5339 stop:5500 length:162 start_codon:yes stop_codon:yes gene_type:complete
LPIEFFIIPNPAVPFALAVFTAAIREPMSFVEPEIQRLLTNDAPPAERHIGVS